MIRRAFGWHRPLMAVAALMAVVAAACLVGGLVDDRVVTGAPVWDKPAKFSLSILVYAVSWAWLIARLPRFRRQAHVVGTVVAVALVIEQAVIVGAAAAGTTSHFNVTTRWRPPSGASWRPPSPCCTCAPSSRAWPCCACGCPTRR